MSGWVFFAIVVVVASLGIVLNWWIVVSAREEAAAWLGSRRRLTVVRAEALFLGRFYPAFIFRMSNSETLVLAIGQDGKGRLHTFHLAVGSWLHHVPGDVRVLREAVLPPGSRAKTFNDKTLEEQA